MNTVLIYKLFAASSFVLNVFLNNHKLIHVVDRRVIPNFKYI